MSSTDRLASPASATLHAPEPGTRSRVRLTALIVASALFMQNLDSTVIATALPTMARSFGAEPVHMSIALTAYLLSLAVFIPASGWIADRYGTRTVFRAAIVVFTLGSVLCGRADSLWFLVLARILQGVGGAMMVPVGRLVLLRTAAKSELVAAMAWLTVPALIGPVVGPPLGGFIVTYFSWRWIFDINVPIGVLGVLLVSLYVEDVRDPAAGRFDFRGLVLSALALCGLLFGCEAAGHGVLPLVDSAALFGVGILASLGYWLHARHHPHPLLDFTLMRLPTFSISIIAGSLFRVAIGALPFLLPMMFQVGFGRTAAESGMITFASSAGAMVMKPAAQRALRHWGFRTVLTWNGILSALLLLLVAVFRPSWPIACIYAVLLISGFFRSLQFTAFNTIAYADVSQPRMSAATSLYSTLQQLSLTLGVTIGAAALEAATTFSGHAVPRPADFTVAFVVIAVLALIAGPIALVLPPDAGAELSGARLAPEADQHR